MILEVCFNNFRIFKNETLLSFKADKRTKYLLSNTIDLDNASVLKAMAIYGPNNSGKSNLINLFKIIKHLLVGDMKFECNRKIFLDKPILSFHIIYNNLDGLGWIKYEAEYDSFKHVFISEKLSKITFYNNGSNFEGVIFEKNRENSILNVFEKDESTYLDILPSDKPFLYTVQLDDGKFSILSKWKESLIRCSSNIEVVKMFNLPLQKTIDMLKDGDDRKISFIKSFVKSADLSVDDFGYGSNIDLEALHGEIDEKVLNEYNDSIDSYKLTTTYGNVMVPSMFFDSSGTKKIEAIASYIYESITKGKILIIDELDNGLHFTLTRAIISAFNNMVNVKGQIIFTAHDLLLIDCKNLLRKDQIYFLSRGYNTAQILSLKSITANASGLREGDSLLKRYNHGDFGAVPLPNFVKELIMLLKDGNE